jgi:hypothetical protein
MSVPGRKLSIRIVYTTPTKDEHIQSRKERKTGTHLAMFLCTKIWSSAKFITDSGTRASEHPIQRNYVVFGTNPKSQISLTLVE